MSRALAVFGALLSLLVLACGDPHDTPEERWASVGRRCPRSARAFSLPKVRADSLPPDADSANQDGRWARIARRVPGGWGGGMFLDQGVPTMYLVDLSKRSEAIAALNTDGSDGYPGGANPRFRKGRWSYDQLYDWYRYLNLRLSIPEISGTDIDEAKNRLAYGVASEAGIRAFEARLVELQVPCFLVAVQLRPLATPASSHERNTRRRTATILRYAADMPRPVRRRWHRD